MKFQVKAGYSGKVKLQDGNGSVVLDENTPQDVLAKFYESPAGKHFIELAAVPVATKASGNVKAGE